MPEAERETFEPRPADADALPWHLPGGAVRYSHRRLSLHPRIGKPTVEATGGLPRRFERLKDIEAQIEHVERRLTAAYDELRELMAGDRAAFEVAWCRIVDHWRFDEVNALIDEHNEWYPLESKLRIDPHTGDYRGLFGMQWRKLPLDADWALERFPAQLRDQAAG